MSTLADTARAFASLGRALRGIPQPAFDQPTYVHYRLLGESRGGVTLYVNPLDNGTVCVTAAVCSIDDTYCKEEGRQLAKMRQAMRGPFKKFWIENVGPRSEMFAAFDAVARHAWLSTQNCHDVYSNLFRTRAGECIVQVA